MSHSARWIDQQTANLLQTDAELRQLLRDLQRGRTSKPRNLRTRAATTAPDTVTLSAYETRTLLRAALPSPSQPIFRGRARQQHAAVITALSLLTSHMVAMADGRGDIAWHARRRSLATALDLIDTLRAWTAEMAWRQATQLASNRWPRNSGPALSISAVTQQQAPPKRNTTRTLATPESAPIARTITAA